MKLRAFIRLCKPGIVRMVGVTAAFSYVLSAAEQGEGSIWRLFAALLGIMASAGGSAALNNVLEKDLDARMERTRGRELPRGEVSPEEALALGMGLTLGGCVWLVFTVNLLTAFLVLLTAFLYVLVYTPLKTRTWWNTSIGAVPGALPTLCGWAAASGHLDFGGWVLFAILFAWQHPHFYAIAWIYRDDYAKAGYRMLSVIDPSGTRLVIQVILFTLLLLALSVLPSLIHMAGWLYLIGAVALGLHLSWHATRFVYRKTRHEARGLLLSSILYLPGLLGIVLADRGLALLF